MTQLQLVIAAESSALAAVQSGATPFAVEQKSIADFIASGSAETDWNVWKQIFGGALSRFANASQRDKQAAAVASAKAAATPKPAAT